MKQPREPAGWSPQWVPYCALLVAHALLPGACACFQLSAEVYTSSCRDKLSV
jgi:hypothetical protein